MDDHSQQPARRRDDSDVLRTQLTRRVPSVDWAIALILASGASYHEADIFRAMGARAKEHIKLLWRAETRIREDRRIVYGPGDAAGERMQLDAASTVRRGSTFGATALRKLRRAFAVVNSVDPAELDAEQKRHLQRVQDRQAQQRVLLALSSRKKNHPPGI